MKTFIQRGENITAPAPVAVSSGAGVLIGSMFGIANADAAAGADVVLSTVGVFELEKVLTDAVAIGDLLYWDNGANLVTTTAAENARIGAAVSAAGNPSRSVRVRLNGSF
jgi:predicted RecA/RadA family phage recombinase